MNSLPPSSPPPEMHSSPPSTSWRILMELLSFAGLAFPLGNILGPLILWLVKKDVSQEVDYEGKRVINFNISWTLWGLASCGIGFIAWLIIAIIASVKAANNQPFKHPWTIQFLK